MKARFKKDIKTWEYATIFVSAIVILAAGIWMTHYNSILYLLWIITVVVILKDYKINDHDILIGSSTRISIQSIHKIVYLPDGVDIHYARKKDGSISMQHFNPRERDEFAAKLKEINPNIQII